MTTRPFTVGIIQDAASPDMAATLEASVARVREAAAARRADHLPQGAVQRAVLLQVAEVRALRHRRADPRARRPTSCRSSRRSSSVVLIVPIFERQARGVYRNSAAIIDADGSLLGVYRKMHIPDDPLFNEKYYFTPGDAAHDDRIDAIGEVAKQASGFRVWQHALREHRRADLLGPVVSRGRAHHEPARRRHPVLSHGHRLAPGREGGVRHRRRSDAWRTIQRSHAIANGVFVASPNRVGHEDEPGTDGIEFFGHSFIADPFGRILAEAGTEPAILVADVRSEADRGHAPQLAVPARPADRCVRADSQSRYLGA